MKTVGLMRSLWLPGADGRSGATDSGPASPSTERPCEAPTRLELSKHRMAKVLQTCPGLGPIRVARLLPIVITPHRFRTRPLEQHPMLRSRNSGLDPRGAGLVGRVSWHDSDRLDGTVLARTAAVRTSFATSRRAWASRPSTRFRTRVLDWRPSREARRSSQP